MIALVLTTGETIVAVLIVAASAIGLVADHRRNGSAALTAPSPVEQTEREPLRDPDAATSVELHNIAMAARQGGDLVTDDGGRYWVMDGRWWCTHRAWLGIERVADPRVVAALNARARRAPAHGMTVAEQRRVARG